MNNSLCSHNVVHYMCNIAKLTDPEMQLQEYQKLLHWIFQNTILQQKISCLKSFVDRVFDLMEMPNLARSSQKILKLLSKMLREGSAGESVFNEITPYIFFRVQQKILACDAKVEETSGSTAAASPADVEGEIKKKRMRWQLVLLIHSHMCKAATCSPHCYRYKTLLQHLRVCRQIPCVQDLCDSSRNLLSHWRGCLNEKCLLCAPVELYFDKK